MILTLDNMPKKAQMMPAKEELEFECGITLNLYQCSKCGLVQFDCEPVEYYKSVIRASAVSEKMYKLRKEQYAYFINLFNLEGKKIWEVGCGGGEFLKILTEFPVRAFGIEYDPGLSNIALKKGLIVENGFVDSPEYRAADGPFDAFMSFNFLEHQPHPNKMLQGIYNNLTENGVGIITVPSFEYFLENASYYEFIRDHIGYYTKDSLSYLLIQNGFSIIEETRFNEDTLCVLVKKRKRVSPHSLIGNKKDMEQKLFESIQNLSPDDKIAIWGASHQAFTILSTTDIGKTASCIIDSAPFKTGYYSPASHLEIVSPRFLKDSDIECIIIMAPGYSDEIFKQILDIKPKIKKVISIIGREVKILRG